MSSGFLHRYFLNNGDKRLHKYFHYFDIYERHFQRFRDRAPTVLEIGVQGGGSLQMWRSYFGRDARIVGLDILPDCAAHAGDGIAVHIGDQTDPAVLDSIIAAHGPPDIVIDDGSHRMDHTIATFELLYPRTAPDGVYLVEDMHVAYSRRYGGGYREPGSFIEYVKDRIDDLHAVRWRKDGPTPFTLATDAICAYEGVFVFERRPRAMRHAIVTGEHETISRDKTFQKVRRRRLAEGPGDAD